VTSGGKRRRRQIRPRREIRRLARKRIEIDPLLRWFVVLTFAQKRTAERLVDAGFGVFLPTTKHRIRQHGKARTFERRPLAPYLFVGLNRAEPPFERVRNVDGVASILNVQGMPIEVAPAILRRLDGELAKGEEEIAKEDGTLGSLGVKPGDLLEVRDGPFVGFKAEVVCLTARRTIEALVEIFGRKTPVEFDLADLRAA
jgi:transcription antitermination factor NusG